MARVGKTGKSSAGRAPMRGLNRVLKNLKKANEKIRLHTKEGLYEAALVIKYDSVKITPIDTSNLRGSCFIRVTDLGTDKSQATFIGDDAGRMASDHSSAIASSKSIVDAGKYKYNAIVAYSAYYAFYVHEMPIHYNFNQGTNQFLLRSLMKNKRRVAKILYKHAKF